jgi:hypothetical protein
MPRINDYKLTDCVTCNGAGEYVEEIHRSDGTTHKMIVLRK